MTVLQAPTSHDHDGPDWCRLTALWLAQVPGTTAIMAKGLKPRQCILHFADHDEWYGDIHEAAYAYDLDSANLSGLVCRRKHGGRGVVKTAKGNMWPELVKKAKKNV
jgi:hypothetical protein